MSLGSTTAKNIAIRANYGSSRSSLWPSTVTFRLYVGNPTSGGTEMTGGGYAGVAVANTDANFPVPTTGVLEPATVVFPTSTGAWSAGAPPTFFAIKDGSTFLDYGPLSTNPGVVTAGQDVTLTVVIDPSA